MTLTEKILARACGKTQIAPGENILANVDVLMTHDVCGPGTIGVFKREFGEGARVWDPEKVVLIPDHFIFTADRRCNRNVDILREFAGEQGIRYFYDVIDTDDGTWRFEPDRKTPQYGRNYAGVCHVALAERGHTRPGEVLVGTDSHTCTAGAFGEFATGIGNTDAAFVMGTGKILLRVPETLRFRLEGRMRAGVMAKDLILHLIGEIGFDGATYQAMEFGGEGAAAMAIEDRMTVANMGVEAGAKNAVFEADALTCAFVEEAAAAHGTRRACEPAPKGDRHPAERRRPPCRPRVARSQSPFATGGFEPLSPDPGARYASDTAVDLSQLEPTVALHPNPGRRARAAECRNVKLDRAYIGSCTGGKTSDFEAFARVVRGKRVAVETFGVPATPLIVNELRKTTNGDPSTWDILSDAGVRMTEHAGCAACLGGPSDTFGRLNRPLSCISTTNRNFPGRMGHPEGRVYLASPYTVAASALTGHIVDPRDYLP